MDRLSPLSVAVLDRRFAAEMTRYPEITATLFDRLSERSLRLATTQAISQLTRVDRRLKALFWHLAERWGRVSGDGVIVPLALTHRILGQLVGARRPTVSTALSRARGARGADPPARRLVAAARRPAGRRVAGPQARPAAPQAARSQDLMRPARRFEREPAQGGEVVAAHRPSARRARARRAARAARLAAATRRQTTGPTPPDAYGSKRGPGQKVWHRTHEGG